LRPTLSYCGQEVHTHDYDRFLLSLFISASKRELFLSIYALNIELARIRGMVSEEMIGHIRHAWWQEAVDGLYAGTPPRGQPVLEALAPRITAGDIPKELLMPVLESYRDHFPGAPPCLDQTLAQLTLALIRKHCPQSEAAWMRAQQLITRHRLRHGQRKNGWLSVRLLWSGMSPPRHSAAA